MRNKSWALALALALAAAPVSLSFGAAGGAGGAAGGGGAGRRCCWRRLGYGHRLGGRWRDSRCSHFFDRAGFWELRQGPGLEIAVKSDGLDRLYDGQCRF